MFSGPQQRGKAHNLCPRLEVNLLPVQCVHFYGDEISWKYRGYHKQGTILVLGRCEIGTFLAHFVILLYYLVAAFAFAVRIPVRVGCIR